MNKQNILTSTEVGDFIAKCRHNVVALHKNLTGIGYRFLRDNGPVQFATESDREALAEIDQRFGPLPIVFRRWYESFSYVDFSQDPKQLYEDGELASGLGCNITLVFRDLRWCLNFREELRAKCKLMSRESLDRSFLPTGGIASNNEPKGIWLPSGSPDAPLYDDGAGPVFFSEEIRVALRAGGFPYWEQMFKRRRVSSHLGFCAKLPELRKVLHRDLVDF